MSDNRAPAWVVPVMRTGYAARGITYFILGGLAVLAAWRGGQAQGTKEALASLRDDPGGLTALWVLAVGLAAYAVWRLIDAWMDLEDYGSGLKGVVARGGQVVTGLIHVGLAVTAARLALGRGSTGDGGGSQSAASWLLTQPYGATLMTLVGAVTIGAGIYYGWKAIAEKYKSHLRRTRRSEKLDPVVKAGLIAHGAVVAIIGLFLIYAGQTSDPSQAGGMGMAFQAIREQAYGQILLGVTALGMIAFGVYCWIEAICRIVPRRAGDDVTTLAHKAKSKAEQTGRQAKAQMG